MIICGTGIGDQTVCPMNETKEVYDKIGENIKKVLAVRKNADHGDMQIDHVPYMTAWFCNNLKDDSEAAKAFCRKDSEIWKNNENLAKLWN